MATAIGFGTDGWRATLDVFTEERVRIVAQSIATYLADHGLTGAPVLVGYDARETSPRFARAVSSVLVDNGIDVIRPQRDIATPVVAWATAQERLAGAVMITASHNPPSYNGIKFITRAGAPALPDVTNALEERLESPQTLQARERASVEPFAGLEAYIDHVLDLVVPEDLADIEIVYDAMHGSGRGITDRVLTAAGARVNAYRCTRDPTFGGGSPEPTAETLTTLASTVTTTDAALGIANDGDADRIAVITPKRGYLDENLLFAAIYEYLLTDASGPAVRTVSTTHLIDRIAEEHGESVVETAVGYKWVAAAMREHDALVGGEESGGFSVRGHVREKDGVLTAALVSAMTVEEPLDDRIDRILETYGGIVQDKISVSCPDDQKVAVMTGLGDVLPETIAGSPVASVSTVDGYKITVEDGGWVLIRPSGTEPKLRVYGEATTEERVGELLAAGRSLVESVD